jgi:hypothetical protein
MAMMNKTKTYVRIKPRSPAKVHYQLSYHIQLKGDVFYDTYEVTMKKMENKIVYYKETVECQHLIFWPGSQRRVHCHTAKTELNWRATIDRVPSLVKDTNYEASHCAVFSSPLLLPFS